MIYNSLIFVLFGISQFIVLLAVQFPNTIFLSRSRIEFHEQNVLGNIFLLNLIKIRGFL